MDNAPAAADGSTQRESRLLALVTREGGLSPVQLAELDSKFGDGRRGGLVGFLAGKGWLKGDRLRKLLNDWRSAELEAQGFKVIKAIGTGAYGTVFHARQDALDRDVAIKLMLPGTGRDPQKMERFEREIRLLAQLDHENLVKAIDAGWAGDCYYLAMNYVDGPSLRAILQERGKIPPDEAMKYALAVARALEYAHGRELIHRDVKPENILVTREGVAKLCDLGLAKSVADDAVQLTQPGMIIGSAQYISPEQIERQGDLDARVDLYALGIVWYEMLTGAPPFTGDSSVRILARHINEQVPWLRDIDPELPAADCRIVQKLTRRKREERYESAGQVIEAIETAQRGAPAEAPAPAEEPESIFGFGAPETAKAPRRPPAPTARPVRPARRLRRRPPPRKPAPGNPRWFGLAVLAAVLLALALAALIVITAD